MKRKLPVFLLGISMALCVCACSDATTAKESNIEESDDVDEDTDEETDEDIEENIETVEDKMPVKVQDEEEFYLADYQSGQVFILNPDSDDFEMIDTNGIADMYVPETLVNLTYADTTCQVFTAQQEDSDYTLYINNADGCLPVMSNLYLPKVGVVDGVVYIDDVKYDDEGMHNVCYACTPYGPGIYNCEDTCEAIVEIQDRTGAYVFSRYYGNRENYGVGYCANKYGIVPLGTTDGIVFYDKVGNFLDKISFYNQENFNFGGFDGRYVSYEIESENYASEVIYVYDLATGETVEVASMPGATYNKSVHTLDVNDGVVYYAVTDFYQDNDFSSCDIHSFDVTTGKDELIKTVTSVLGHDYSSNPGVFAFKAIENTVYFLDESDSATCWFKATYDGEKWSEAQSTDMVAKEYEFASYGRIIADDFEMQCPYCDKTAYSYHNEYMEFDSRVNNYEKINELIKEAADTDMEHAQNFEVLYSEEDCSGYLHGPSELADSSEESISRIRDVRRVLDHYIFTSNIYYYYPIGAAHGWSAYDNHLYDEETGEETSFAELYTGDETKLKELVAEGVCDMYDEGSVYFFEEERDNLYATVYKMVDKDNICVSFYNDYLTVDFMQYELAPYSEGIISVRVSYIDLFETNVSKNTDDYDMDFVDVFGEHYTATINTSLPMHPYEVAKIKKEDGRYYYEDDTYTSVLGIDASKYQGAIDFDTVKDNGYEFAYLRIGYRGYGKDGTLAIDNVFEQNFVAAIDAGLDVGVYFFSQAINEDEAREEAEFVLKELDSVKKKYGSKYVTKLPVVYDPETILDHEARTDDVSAEQFTGNVHAYINAIEDNGYDGMLYCNMLWQIFSLTTDDIFDGSIRIWYADYEPLPQTPYMFEMWQYTNEANVPGVKGAVDVDMWIKKK